MNELVRTGRLPISEQNIRLLVREENVPAKVLINNYSEKAALTMIGIREELIKKEKEKVFSGYDLLGTVLFVHSSNQKEIG
jgi:hypothetical protein